MTKLLLKNADIKFSTCKTWPLPRYQSTLHFLSGWLNPRLDFKLRICENVQRQQSVYCTAPFIIISLLLQFHTFQFLSFSSSLWTTIMTSTINTSWVGHNVSEALTGLWLEHLEKRVDRSQCFSISYLTVKLARLEKGQYNMTKENMLKVVCEKYYAGIW